MLTWSASLCLSASLASFFDRTPKFWLLWNGITQGRTDGALVRLLTVVQLDETEKAAFDVSIDAVRDLTAWVENNFSA